MEDYCVVICYNYRTKLYIRALMPLATLLQQVSEYFINSKCAVYECISLSVHSWRSLPVQGDCEVT